MPEVDKLQTSSHSFQKTTTPCLQKHLPQARFLHIQVLLKYNRYKAFTKDYS